MAEPRSPRVRRSEADEVYVATATEPLRKSKSKSPLFQSEAEAERIRKEAESLVEKGKKRVKKERS